MLSVTVCYCLLPQENHILGNDIYCSEGVSLLCEALKDPNCRLEELHLGLNHQQHGMHERDAARLGHAVRACKSLRVLSITSALLPMGALLDGGPTVDLAGKGLARVEVEIAAARDLRSISPVPPLHLPCISAGGDRRAAAAW